MDVVATRYGCTLQGTTEVALSLLDVLGYLEEIPVCTAYKINGTITHDFPTTNQLELAEPVIEKLPGWQTDISHIRSYIELPIEAKNYIDYIEHVLGFPITYISVGPERDAIITR